MKTLTKKQKEANGENFSRIVDDAAILLQRKADYVMNIKQVADYLGIFYRCRAQAMSTGTASIS